MAAASDPVAIPSAARTPLGRFIGELSSFIAHKLGPHAPGTLTRSPERQPAFARHPRGSRSGVDG